MLYLSIILIFGIESLSSCCISLSLVVWLVALFIWWNSSNSDYERCLI
ncbi:unnamed protein product [Acidithrix sp. C25]|nr:unnamed protein product [Acidithrix sp. C25]